MYKYIKKKSLNRNRILECIFRNAPISRSTIAEMTGITPATTTLTISDMISEGIVYEAGWEFPDSSDVGRKRVALDINKDYCYALGIEFNQKAFCLCVTDLKGNIIHSRKQPYTESLSRNITEMILKEIPAALSACSLKEEQLAGIGIALPGHINKEFSKVVSNTTVWENFDGTKIINSFKVPVIFENNVRSMALSRYLFHPECTPDSFAFFHVGMGMFCANMADGRLFLGNTYVSGEIGHTIVNPNGLRCECGKQGCLQTIASERWLIQNAKKLCALDTSSILNHLVSSPEEITTDTIVTAFSMGDEAVSSYIANALKYLGISTSNIAILMNPEKIFLHGKIFTYPEIHKELMDIINKQLTFVERSNVESVEILPYREEDGAAGGAALAILEGWLQVSYY